MDLTSTFSSPDTVLNDSFERCNTLDPKDISIEVIEPTQINDFGAYISHLFIASLYH
jgi:hypothetical protein